MIIWSGWGIATALIGVLGLVFAVVVPEKLTGSKDFLKHHTWVWMLAMSLAALVNFGFYKLFLAKEKSRIVIDKQTGQEIHLRKNHSLFFIPVKWWSFIFIALGILLLFARQK